MTEPKPFATLSSGLLARKGGARPAMRPQSFRFNADGTGLAMASASLDDLGWNDMGEDVEAPVAKLGVAPQSAPVATLVIPPRVVVQQEELAQRLEAVAPTPVVAVPVAPVQTEPVAAVAEVAPAAEASPAPATVQQPPLVEPGAVQPSSRVAASGKPRAAFTLRLDPERHLRLRLVCAVSHRSAQQVVTQALDEFLASRPENSRLATQR